MNELLIHNVEEKLKKECEKVQGQKEGVIKGAVMKALLNFSKQESEFAQAIVESNDIAGMTVEEVKSLVAENSNKGEQINMLQEDIAEREETINELEDKEDKYKDRIQELEAELEAAKNKPTEVAVREPSAEEIAKIKQAAEDKAKKSVTKELKALEKKLTESHKKELDDLKAKSKAEIEKAVADYKNQLSDSDKEKNEAVKRAEILEKQLAVSSSAETATFKTYFESCQNDLIKIEAALKAIKAKVPENAERYKEALLKYLDGVKEIIKGV